MNIDTLKRLLTFVILLLAQVLVFNHIHLFNCATPLIYVYIVLDFEKGYPRWGVLAWSFAMGLCNDIFLNTPGVATASMTLIGLLQPYLLQLMSPRDATEEFKASIDTLGFAKYTYYLLTILAVYCIAFFIIEMFNFFNMFHMLLCVLGSLGLTMLLILAIKNLQRK